MATIKFIKILSGIFISVFIIMVINCYGSETAEDFFKKGKEFSTLNNNDDAISNYSKAIKLDPKMVKAYNNRGVAYVGRNQYEQAIDDFTKVIELDPKHGKAYNNRAIAYWSKGDKEKARQDLEKAKTLGITVDPDFFKKIQGQTSPTK
jgi:tetratricopeptide (TPR) repeat protein